MPERWFSHDTTRPLSPARPGLGAQRDEQGNGTLSKGLQDYDSILSSLAAQFGTTPKKEKGKKKRKHRHKCVATRAGSPLARTRMHAAAALRRATVAMHTLTLALRARRPLAATTRCSAPRT